MWIPAVNLFVLLIVLYKVTQMDSNVQAQLDKMNQSLNDINDYTNNLATDLEQVVGQNKELIDKLNAGDADVVSDLESINTKLTERADALKALASQVDQPVPPPPATPVQ